MLLVVSNLLCGLLCIVRRSVTWQYHR